MRALLLLMLASAAAAKDLVGPHCPEGRRARFSGHAFRVWECAAEGSEKPASAPPAPALPDPKDKAAADLRALAGVWKGLVLFGGKRYEVRLELRAKGRGATGEWWAMDYHTHDKRALKGRLSPPLFSKGRYRGFVESEHFAPVGVEVRTGKPTTGDAAGFEAEAVWTYEGSKDRHRVLFSRPAPDRLSFRYSAMTPGQPDSTVSGELSRE